MNVTSVSANVNIEASSIRYVESAEWSSAKAAIDGFLTDYVVEHGVSEIYHWQTSDSSISFGVLVPDVEIVKLYFLTITYR